MICKASDPWEALAREIRAQAAQAGICSMAQLARESGCSEGSIHDWLSNPKSMKLGKLAKIVQAVEIDPSVLMSALLYKEGESNDKA